MVPIASISGATRARVDGDITASASIEVRATGENHVDARADIGSLAVFGASGAVALATIDTSAAIEALVGASSSLASSGAVVVDAHTVGVGNKAFARARLISGGAFGSFGVMVSIAKDNGGIAARLNGDVTSSQSVTVTANGVHRVDAFSLVVSVGLTASMAGAGSLAEIGSSATVEATVGLTSQITSAGAVKVIATSDFDALSESHIGSGGAVSVGVAVPTATIDGGTRAQFAGDITTGASLTVTAVGDYDAEAKSIPVSIGLLSLMAAASTAEIKTGAQVEAHIGVDDSLIAGLDGSSVNVTGAVRVTATAPMTATAMASGANIGGILALSIMLPTAKVNGSVKAYVRDGTALTASALSVLAEIVDDPTTAANETAANPFTATATTFVLGFGGIASGAGANAEASVTGTVEAFVGAPVGRTPGGTAGTKIQVSGQVKIEALSDVKATAKADGFGAAGALAVTAMVPHANAGGTTRAFIGQGANVDASSVDIDARGTYLATATTIAVSIAGLGALNAVNANADVTGITDAHIGAAVGETAAPTPSKVNAHSGSVTVDAWSSMTALATANGGGAAIAITVNVMLPTATVSGVTRAYVGDSVDLDAGSLRITADAPTMKAEATSKVAGISGFGSGNGVVADAFVTGVVEAFIGAPRGAVTSAYEPDINVGLGDVTVDADSYMFAHAIADGVGGSLGLSIGVMLPTANVSGRTSAYVRDHVDIVARNVKVQAGTAGDRVVYRAEATSLNINIGLISGTGVEADATTTGIVEAFVGAPAGAVTTGAGTTVLNLTGALTISAFSDIDAIAKADGGGAGALSVNIMLPTADAAGATMAYVGQGTHIEAASVDVDADGELNAQATTIVLAAGLAAATIAKAEATVSGLVDAHIGSSAGSTPSSQVSNVNVNGAITIDAHAVMTATPTLTAVSVGVVAVSVLFPTTTLTGIVRAYIGEGVDVDAASVRIKASAPTLAAVATATGIGVAALAGLGIIDADAINNSQVEAFIGAHRSINASNVTTDVDVDSGALEILIDTSITATASADSIGITGAVALSALAPTARVGGYAGTYVRDGVNIDAGSLTLQAGTLMDRVVMKAKADGDAVQISAVFSGSLVIAEAIADGTVESFIGAGVGRTATGDPTAVIAVDGAITVLAASDIDAVSTVNATAVGAVAITALIPTSWALGATRAFAGDGTNVRTTGLSITADGDVRADATTKAFAIGLGAGNGAGAEAVVNSRTEAFLGQRVARPGDPANPAGTRNVEVYNAAGTARGTVTVTATTKSVAHAQNDGVSVGGIAINVMTPKAKLSGYTSAYIGPNTAVYAGTATLTANDPIATAEASTFGASVGGVTITVLIADSRVSRAIEAFVGAGASVDLGANSLTATATSPSMLANATAEGGSGSVIGISSYEAQAYVGDDTIFLPSSPANPQVYNAVRPTLTTRSVTRAFIDNGAKIVNRGNSQLDGANNVTLTATATTTANADIDYLGIGGLLSAAVSKVEANVGHDAEVYVGDDAVVRIAGTLKAAATTRSIASPNIVGVSVGAITIDVLTARGKISSDTGAWIGNGAEVTAAAIDLDATAGNPNNLATLGHDAAVTIDSSGFGAFLRITLLEAVAEDVGSVFVRLGPTGAGSAGNRTVVTATGSGGISADAFLNSGIRAEPNFSSFSLFGAGGSARSYAHGDATVSATVGGYSNLSSGPGDLHVQAEFVGRTEANASGLAGAIGVSVVKSNADADHDPTVTATVAANASLTSTGLGRTIEILARHNFRTEAISGKGSFSSASNMAFGLLGAGLSSDIHSNAEAVVSNTVAEGASFTTNSGNVTIASYNANRAFSAVDSKAGAAVAIATGNVYADALGSTTTTFNGNVGTLVAAGASQLDVLAVGYATADAALKSRSGGIVNAAKGGATANVDPDLTVNFGAASTVINVGGSIAVTGNQATDADARADGAGGGAVSVSGFKATITVTPDVDVNVGDTNQVIAGSKITILAQHGGGTPVISDGTVLTANDSGNYVVLTASGASVPLAHQLAGGETIVYTGSCCGLVTGRAYNVIVRDSSSIYLGNSFNAGTQVSVSNDTIRFSRLHNFVDGESVYYSNNGGATIGGLSNSTRYTVNVIDEFTIKLLPFGASEIVAIVSNINDVAETITVNSGHGFVDGQNVVYRAPTPTLTFSSALVDVNSKSPGSLGPDFQFSGSTMLSVDNNMIFAGTLNANGTWSPHSFFTGQGVVYNSPDGSPIGGLSDGAVYFVIKVNDYQIRLASSYCNAVGSPGGTDACALPDGGDEGTSPDPRPVSWLALAPSKTAAAINERHTLTDWHSAPITGLIDGATYLVDLSTPSATTFKLKTLGGSPVAFEQEVVGSFNPQLGPATFSVNVGPGHRFVYEGINLTSVGSGIASLIVDLGPGGGGRFSGIGGASTLSGSDSGDLESVASATGKTGGAINVGNVETIATGMVDTNLNIASGASLQADVIDILTKSTLNITATSDGSGGGAVSISGAQATATGTNNSTIDIAEASGNVIAPSLSARAALTVQAHTISNVNALAASSSGGFAGGDSTNAYAYSDYYTQVNVGGVLDSDGALIVTALTDASADAESESDFGAGFGDAGSNAVARVGRGTSATGVVIETNAVLTGATVAITAQTNGRANADADADADGFGLSSHADGTASSAGLNSVTLQKMAKITGTESVSITADQKQTVFAKAVSRCDCFAGSKNANANASATGTSLVTGQKDAFIWTADLKVFAKATGTSVTRNASTGGGFIVFGGSGGGATYDIKRHIDWESTVIMLGEPNPEIEIDESGKVVTLVNITGVDGNGGALVLNNHVGGSGPIVLDDIVYDSTTRVLFETDEFNGLPTSQIWGNAAIFDFQQTWDYVKIVNRSPHDLIVNLIDVTLAVGATSITVNVKNVPNSDAFTFRTVDVGEGQTFDFEIIHSYIPTLIEIYNLQVANSPPSENGWDIILKKLIENPIGTTRIRADRGDIENGGGNNQLIRTNILDLDTPNGSIGSHTDPNPSRVPINVELIESDYTETGVAPASDPDRRMPVGTYSASKVGPAPGFSGLYTREIVITADAAGDVVLNVQSKRHADASRAALHPFVITVGPIVAGGDIDIFVLDSFDRTGLSGPGGVFVHRTAVGTVTNFGQAGWERFFRPDCTPVGYSVPCDVRALGVYLTSEAALTGNYLFASTAENYSGLGDGIANGDRPSGVTPFLKAGDFISVRHLTGGQITYTGIVDADSDNNGQGSVILLTNGFINVEERAGDFRVDQIASSQSDVTIWALGRVLDAEDDAQTTPDPFVTFTAATPTSGTDVRGVNITLFSGLGGIAGGIGSSGNYLELDVDVLNGNGVLNAIDIFAASTSGIFITETSGDLELDTVWTLRDVSLSAIDGNINDARNNGAGDDEVNVLGQTIDLDANDYDATPNAGSGPNVSAHIGNPNGTNDVEIDSQRAGAGDVSLEADGSIFVTEADAKAVRSYNVTLAVALDTYQTLETIPNSTLRLVLARAWAGNIRLTVRDEANPIGVRPEDDDLVLLPNGNFQRGEDDLLTVPNGTIIARLGSVLLRIGDDVILHQNSQILAGTGIAIYGDATAAAIGGVDPDPGFGSDMLLLGRLVAGCINPGALSCEIYTGTPIHTITIWGNDDVDQFQFGDVTGLPTVGNPKTTLGDPGYVYLGAKTRVYGDDDLMTTNPDGQDQFLVYYLQSMFVATAPANATGANLTAGHSLTLDGQAGTDTYHIWTTGSKTSSPRNYAINILDTGAANDGVDEAFVYGFDSTVNGDPTPNDQTDPLPSDDIFLLRAQTCIDTETLAGLTAGGACVSPTETADRPAFVALLHGNVADYRFDGTGDVSDPNPNVQRINYDTGLNGRLTVLTYGGNDSVFVDDTTVNITIDTGAGNDSIQIGQIFGTKRDAAGGSLLAADTFPTLIATTRGWLSPGTHAPLVVHGGTGEDKFTVYSNQAELRLEGDDGNDLFVIRAFALAATCDTDATGDGVCDLADVTLNAHPVTGNFPKDSDGNGVCSGAEMFGFNQSFRKDNNGDGTCNNADADRTLTWLDDVIPLDANGVAVPIIGLGFSIGRPLDIRTGGGDDEVQYNVNAPVSVDGGTGIDKLVVLATEFADDIVITSKGIFGAGLNVRYTNLEIIEVDGLEGDDEFFVQSTAFGVAYRIIGGLGSDSMNVTGDVVEDIVTQDLDGLSGTVDFRALSADFDYSTIPIDGIEVRVATAEAGKIIITETGGFTAVREQGAPTLWTPASGNVDKYSIRLAAGSYNGIAVYVTVSAARSPEEEANDKLVNPTPLTDGPGDTIWLCTGDSDAACSTLSQYRKHYLRNGVWVDAENRALVLTFTSYAEQFVYVWAVDQLDDDDPATEIDNRSEGERIVVINHTVISADTTFDGIAVRNVEVKVRDNDTPGVIITQVGPGSSTVEDGRTVVVEGTATTRLTDEILVELAKEIAVGKVVVVKLAMDADSAQALQLSSLDARFKTTFVAGATEYRIEFNHLDWNTPVRIVVAARDDFRVEDPQTAVIRFVLDSTTDSTYEFPNLRSGPGLLAVEVIDDDSPGVVTIESGGSTFVELGGATDTFDIRLTGQPTANVQIAIVTDGLTDVVKIGNTTITPADYTVIGGIVPVRMFLGNVTINGNTITRALGSDLGSFIEEGFEIGQNIRIVIGSSVTDVTITGVTGQASRSPAACLPAPIRVPRSASCASWANGTAESTSPSTSPTR
jgi:hypothetical protein